MPDALGWRAKFGVAIPSTNTIVQPDFDCLRPPGVTNHISRIHVPNMAIDGNAAFAEMIRLVEGELDYAIDRVMTAAPTSLLIGISSVIFWDGYDASARRRDALAARTGLPVSGGSFALVEALRTLGAGRVAAFSPYQPVADRQVIKFLADCGIEVVRFKGLKCASPTAIAEVDEATLRAVLREIDGDEVDALVQIGTNLSMMRLAAEAERWLDKPVLAINAVTYWHALRQHGIADRVDGYGRLLAEY